MSYFVQDMLRLRILTIIAASILVSYFYLQPVPMMTVVYWNLFFIGLNAIQLCRILLPRLSAKFRKKDKSLGRKSTSEGDWKARVRKLPGRCRPVPFNRKGAYQRNRNVPGGFGIHGLRLNRR